MITEKTRENFKRVMSVTDNNMCMIFYAWLLEEHDKVDKTTQEYKSLAGQKDLFIETERFFLHLSDEELLTFERKYKEEWQLIDTKIYGSDFIDLDIMIDLIHLHKMIRFFNKYFDLACFFEVARTYSNNRKRAKALEVSDSCVVNYCRTIMSR